MFNVKYDINKWTPGIFEVEYTLNKWKQIFFEIKKKHCRLWRFCRIWRWLKSKIT